MIPSECLVDWCSCQFVFAALLQTAMRSGVYCAEQSRSRFTGHCKRQGLRARLEPLQYLFLGLPGCAIAQVCGDALLVSWSRGCKVHAPLASLLQAKLWNETDCKRVKE